jgi:hypothetical protein
MFESSQNSQSLGRGFTPDSQWETTPEAEWEPIAAGQDTEEVMIRAHKRYYTDAEPIGTVEQYTADLQTLESIEVEPSQKQLRAKVVLKIGKLIQALDSEASVSHALIESSCKKPREKVTDRASGTEYYPVRISHQLSSEKPFFRDSEIPLFILHRLIHFDGAVFTQRNNVKRCFRTFARYVGAASTRQQGRTIILLSILRTKCISPQTGYVYKENERINYVLGATSQSFMYDFEEIRTDSPVAKADLLDELVGFFAENTLNSVKEKKYFPGFHDLGYPVEKMRSSYANGRVQGEGELFEATYSVDFEETKVVYFNKTVQSMEVSQEKGDADLDDSRLQTALMHRRKVAMQRIYQGAQETAHDENVTHDEVN